MKITKVSRRLYPGDDYPGIHPRANGAVRIEVSTGRGGGPGDYVSVVLYDEASGETLADLRIDPAQMWMLMQGGSQAWPAFISPHLDRVGKRMENQRVALSPALIGDSEQDVHRDVWRAVNEQLADDWRNGQWDAYDTPRNDNAGNRYTVVRRWRAAGDETP